MGIPFRARRAKDKNVIMTMVVKEASPSHKIKSIQKPYSMILDKETLEVLKYDVDNTEKNIDLNIEILKAHPVVQYRADLLDCEIDICSSDVRFFFPSLTYLKDLFVFTVPQVLALFTENFDYQDMRKHFVKGTLESDVLGKKILSYVIADQYAARVGSLPAYDIVRSAPFFLLNFRSFAPEY